MRYIDDIIKAVNDHPHLSPIEKWVINNRIERRPTPSEFAQAREAIDDENHLGWTQAGQGMRYFTDKA